MKLGNHNIPYHNHPSPIPEMTVWATLQLIRNIVGQCSCHESIIFGESHT